MFERSLSALIKGLRSHRGKDEPKYVAQVMDEIRHEVRSGDMDVKAEAVLKLTYLQMLGYPFSNASFHMLEIMASPRYNLKQVGYLAAAQCFSQDTDVLILATNMIKKDLHSSNPLDVAVALNGLSHIVTPDLARHLAPDTIALLTHSKPMIRKKALLVLYCMIIKCPDVLEQAWDRLREKLDDSDLAVVSAAVNIICELARRDPQPFVQLSPQLFHLLTTSTNNWMLIKLIKLFASLTRIEPRLIRKLVPPITTIISTTPAMSLLYECIHTVIIGGMLDGPDGESLAETCVDKLTRFLEDADQNLKYISLLALVKILPSHPHLVAQHQDTIFQSINDPDLSIRLRALELVSGMASARNLRPIVTELLTHLDPPATNTATAAASALKATLSADPAIAAALDTNPALSPTYRLEIVRRILALGSADTYANVHDFEWWIDVLIRIARVADLPIDGGTVRDQLIDVTSRVRAVRPYAVRAMLELLPDPSISGQVYHAVAWILGEYAADVPPSTAASAIRLLLRPHPGNGDLDARSHAAVLHNAIKLFAYHAASATEDLDAIRALATDIASALPVNHTDTEVAQRAAEFAQLFRLLARDLAEHKDAEVAPKSLNLLSPLFLAHQLGPVAERAQASVPLPEDIDLDATIVPPEDIPPLPRDRPRPELESPQLRPQQQPQAVKKAANPQTQTQTQTQSKEEDINAIPIVKLDLDLGLDLGPAPQLEQEEMPESARKKKVKKKGATPTKLKVTHHDTQGPSTPPTKVAKKRKSGVTVSIE